MATSLKTSETLLLELRRLILNNLKSSSSDKGVFVGFDGFIDTIQKAVQQTTDDKTTYFSTIRDFANHLNRMDGKSGQVELVTNQIKLGGNAPILSNAFGRLGVNPTCMGSMGFPEVNPVFKNNINPQVKIISVAEPGKSSAIEFDNGKIIFSDLSAFKQYDWDYIKKQVGLATLRKIIQPAKLIALVDWSNLSRATHLWRGLLEDIIMPGGKRDQLFLFDLCDPSKKSVQQIKEALDLISAFSGYGTVTLGLNENEANKIWLALHSVDQKINDSMEVPPLKTVGYFIYRALEIDTLLIHPVDRTIVFKNQKNFGKQSIIELKGHVVANPKILTGAGDNLNAGYGLGLMADFEVQYCMLLGMAVAGAYVQHGASPGIDDIVDYIDKWMTSLKTIDQVAA